eukprot:961023-Pelagomonas_calceolata.AAC.2
MMKCLHPEKNVKGTAWLPTKGALCADAKETWPTFRQRILDLKTHKDEPDLSIPAADLGSDKVDSFKGKGLTRQTAQIHGNKNKTQSSAARSPLMSFPQTHKQAI